MRLPKRYWKREITSTQNVIGWIHIGFRPGEFAIATSATFATHGPPLIPTTVATVAIRFTH
jgi:hypothetical protein